MGKYICAIDSTWDLTLFGDNYINFWWSVRVKSVQDMVSKVMDAVGNKKISSLVIIGHGSPGFQGVGCGKGSDPTDEKSLNVESTTGKLTGNAEHYMGLLKPKFETGAIVSLGGCATGAKNDGEILLKRLALILGVKVEAGIDTQRLSPGFEGRVRRCDSNTCTLMPASWFY
jgi:hypothetical protein